MFRRGGSPQYSRRARCIWWLVRPHVLNRRIHEGRFWQVVARTVEGGSAAVAITVAKTVVYMESDFVRVAFARRNQVSTTAEQLDGALSLFGFGYGVLHLLRHLICLSCRCVADKRKYTAGGCFCQRK